MTQKKVLILNISHNEIRMMLALKEMGFWVIATGNQPDLPGREYADEYIQQDYSNKEEILKLAIELKIDAICACCNDMGVITAAYVAEKLGLPGHDTYENTLIMHHKDKFKKFAKEHGINTPLAEYFSNEEEAVAWLSSAEYPIIIKPTDLSGGKGVSRADNYAESVAAVRLAFSKSKIKKIVIEPFIEGTQHACCFFIQGQKVVASCSNNEYSFVNPYLVEVDTFPAENIEDVKQFLVDEAEKMCSILKLKDGILHMQYRMKDGKPYIIEAMRRVLGNLYMVPAEQHTGINWDYWEARTHCGLDCSDFPRNVENKGFYAYRTVMGTKNGMVKKIIIPDELKKYMFGKFVIWDPDKAIENFQIEPLAFLFFGFETKEEMNTVILNRYSDIYVEYETKKESGAP